MPVPDTEYSDAQYVGDELKKTHKPLYLCTLYFDEDKQDSVRALLLFTEGLRKIPETISEPMLGEIRTTWWRELIEKGNLAEAGAPLARELLRAIHRHNLDKNLFYSLLDGITADLYVQLYEDQEQIQSFFESTSANIFRICGTLTGINHNDAFSAAGQVLGRALHLYETPKSLQRQKLYWSQDLLQHHSVSTQMVFEQNITPEIEGLISSEKEQVLDGLTAVNKQISTLDTAHKPAFASLALVRPWIRSISQTQNILSDMSPLSQLGFQWHLWKCGKKGTF